MEVGQLRAHIDNLECVLATKIKQQREILEGQLAGLQIYVSNKAGRAVRTVMMVPRTKKREGQAKISEQEEQRHEVVGQGHASRMDAGRDEGHEADKGELCHQVAGGESPSKAKVRFDGDQIGRKIDGWRRQEIENSAEGEGSVEGESFGRCSAEGQNIGGQNLG
jgi:hypothetical protein